jgi:hypothetical protein
MSSRDFIQDVVNQVVNNNQSEQLALHKRHIRALWHHIEQLEEFISTHRDGSITISVGQASVTLKKNGDITLKGKNIDIQSSGKIDVKASSELVLKGQKILQN